MARGSADEKERGQTTHKQKSRALDSTRPSVSEIEEGGSGAMGGQSRPWLELKGEEAGLMDKTATRSTSDSDNGVGSSVAAAKQGTADEMAIEMDTVTTHATGSEPGSSARGAGRDGAAAEAAVGGIEYKVYKRRWFGLLQLTLLNIIVSWDVSAISCSSALFAW
jgi:hypothetical protein